MTGNKKSEGIGHTIVTLTRDMVRMLRMLASCSPGTIPWLFVWAIVDAASTVATPYTVKRLVDSVGPARVSGLITIPLAWVLAQFALAALKGASQLATTAGTHVLQARGPLEAVKRVLSKSFNVEFTKLEDGAFVNRLARAREDATVHSLHFGASGIVIVRVGLTFFGCLGLLLTVSAWTLPVLAASAIPVFVLNTRLARRMFELEHSNMHRNRQGWYLEWLLTAEATAKEVRSLAAGRWLVRMYEGVHTPYREGRVAIGRRHFWRGTLPQLLGVVALYGPYVYVVIATVRGSMSIGTMLLFVLAFQQGSIALTQMLESCAQAFERHLYVRNIFEILDEPEDDPEVAPGEGGEMLSAAPAIAFEGVGFSYPGAESSVLRGLDLEIRAGETLALVGRNGAGKTTLVKLLAGLYAPDTGKILIDDVDAMSKPNGWRRQNVGVVFQDFVRFEFSVAKNVGVGWCSQDDDEEAIRRALAMADANELVDSLERGIDTPLGVAFGGRVVSGGQWQRIALARLFMRRSRIWILDEPTSAMDPEAEERTFRRFHELVQGRTAIIVAHRFSTVRIADRIAVVDGGRVVELGTHKQLLAKEGIYARTYRMQARAFAHDSDEAPGGSDEAPGGSDDEPSAPASADGSSDTPAAADEGDER